MRDNPMPLGADGISKYLFEGFLSSSFVIFSEGKSSYEWICRNFWFKIKTLWNFCVGELFLDHFWPFQFIFMIFKQNKIKILKT